MISPTHLDRLMHRGWPGLTNLDVDGWVVRLAAGVTTRANSVLPARRPRDLKAALSEVESIYRRHSVAPAFQISPSAQPQVLDAFLAERGYERRAPTLVWTANTDRVLRRLASPQIGVSISDGPDEAWMDCWWSVDGRGGLHARAIARQILLSRPALYATSYDMNGVVAVGCLALVGTWGGVYCMAVKERSRRRGYGKTVLRALLQEGERRRIRQAWLQVVEGNAAAQSLYREAGFVSASRYHYRIRC